MMPTFHLNYGITLDELAAHATRNGCQRHSCGTQQHIHDFNVVSNNANIVFQLWVSWDEIAAHAT